MPQLVVSRPLVPSLSVIVDAKEREYFWNKLMMLWCGCPRTMFPGCNPVSLSNNNIHFLKTWLYHITLKSDGVRYILFLTTRRGASDDNPMPVALMIDRAGNMYEIDVMARAQHFVDGTALEVELVWRQPEETEMSLLAFDCIAVQGKNVTKQPFSYRLAELQRLTNLSEEFAKYDDVEQRIDETDTVVVLQFSPRLYLRPKLFVSVEHAQRLWSDRRDCGHRVDGLILQASDAPYMCGTAKDGSALKWKEKSTVDLKGNDHLATSENIIPTVYRDRNIIVRASRIVAHTPDDIIEYLLDVTDDEIGLFAVRSRPDKLRANSDFVFFATIDDVMASVQPADIAEAATVSMLVEPP